MIEVTVAYATPDKQIEIPVSVEKGANIAIAIRASDILKRFPEIPFPEISVGIYGKRATLDAPIEAGDRIEIYRPLEIDPKQARLLRAKK